MNRIPKLNDRELFKLIKILGSYQVKMLWCKSKISLSDKQLNLLIEYKEDGK